MAAPKKLKFRHNVEKKYFETWTDDRPIENFPHPYRMLISGRPNSGKTTTALSIICEAKPIWDEIIILHAKYFDSTLDSPDNKDIEISPEKIDIPEYKDIDFTCALKTIPTGYSYFQKFQNKEGSKKNLLIIDDCELKEWAESGKGKLRKSYLNKTFSYQSTHYGLSIVIITQDPTTQLNPGIRRNCNVYIAFKGLDRNAVGYYAQGVGFPKSILVKLFDYCSSNHDSICFDNSDGSPYPLRYNIVNRIELVKDDS